MSAISSRQNGPKQSPPSLRTLGREHTPPKRDARLWSYLMTAVLAGALVAFVAYLVLGIQWRQRPFPGALVSHTLVVNSGFPATGDVWPGLEAGLQFRDQIIAINGQQLVDPAAPDYVAARAAYHSIISGLEAGQTITVEFLRPGAAAGPDCTPQAGGALCTVSYMVQPLPDGDFLSYFIIPFLSGVGALVLAGVVLRLRFNQPVALMASLICVLTALFMAGISDVGSTHILIPLWLVATALLGGALATLGLLFPARARVTYRYPVLLALPLALSALLAAAAVYLYYTGEAGQFALPVQLATLAAVLGTVMLGLVMLFWQRPRASTTTARDQSNSVLIGIALTALPTLLWLANRLLQLGDSQAVIPISFEAMMPFFITPLVSIVYAVLQYRSFDTDRVISSGITYTILMVALIIGYFLLVVGTSTIAIDLIQANNLLLVSLTIFIMAVLFLPARTHLQRRIDEIYFRVRQDYQRQVEEFAQRLTTVTEYADILREFRNLLARTLMPETTFIFLPDRQTGEFVAYGIPEPETDIHFTAESGVMAALEGQEQALLLDPGQPWPYELQVDRPRLALLRAMVLAPLPGVVQLNGFVVIGPSRSGQGVYNYEQMRFINSVVSQLALAIERAQVIDSLQRRVRELDVLSQVGQAVNFTIEFDDLLELISAQTSRLIDAANFYIALHDPTVNQLYFAFYLEDDERNNDRENRRWPLGNDPFSDVVRSGQALRLPDYNREIARRDLQNKLVSDRLRAWIGVPLIAGPRTLGVIAIGKTKIGESYTDEQFKILSDIGALAATSIDKARLFAETNMRARQLGALNDISRQLVAIESDVEKLLELITSSAVEILNAEAGSLLLTVDDASLDLEFRVVIGGSGQELIGSRLKSGQGVVGQVATEARMVIVNDAAHDPQHATASDVSKDFATTSLLAVPLIAKDRVIGVLEVLNKVDGTIFTEEDGALLTTFAGQAAVAIENARLFQMTDIQLSQRVQELETLERIDAELNRTLDLGQVAKITVSWAISNSGADAGALGIISGNMLYVVAAQGYEIADYPEGADGMRWPLDRGIVKRVMRSRQADLVTDVSIDPDYEPSLHGCISQITIPMFSGDEINALLILEKSRAPVFNLGDWAFAQRLAEHASIAIANAQLYAELTRANESKSEFMGFAAHELKNPLTSVIGFADILLKGATGGLSEQQEKAMSVISSNAKRMELIIEDLREAARIEANQLKMDLAPIDFRHVVIESLRPLQQALDERGQKMVYNVPSDLPLILGDQNRLIQVMTNLLTNAHKYSPVETTVTVDTEVIRNYRSRTNKRIGDVLKISVRDEGIGMSEEDLKKLFHERYFRSDNPLAQEQPGTGLGMMITQGIIENHGGEIWVESTLGEGSTFHFVIPLAPESEQVRQQPESESASD